MAMILVVDDEPSINDLICKNLGLAGHECMSAYGSISAMDVIRKMHPDLIILDVTLPGLSGFDLIKLIENIPVIFVSARSSLEDRIKGLSLGAEDYIVKPFEILELMARVNVVLRRTKQTTQVITIDNLSIDFSSRKVFCEGVCVELTAKEYALLEVLIQNRNIVLTRDKLLDLVWGYDYTGDARTIDVHIKQLRKKLGLKDRINTIYKVGYRFDL